MLQLLKRKRKTPAIAIFVFVGNVLGSDEEGIRSNINV